MAEEKNIATGQIGNALRSTAADHTTTFADEIFDTERQKYQNEVNTDLETTDNEIKADLEAETTRAKAAEEANAKEIARGIFSDNIEFNRVVKELYIEKLDETYPYDYSIYDQLNLYINSDSGNWSLILSSSQNEGVTIGLDKTTSKPDNGFYMFYSANRKLRAYMLIN